MRADHQTSRQWVASMAVPMIAIALASTAAAASGPVWAQAGGPEVTFEERPIVQGIPGSRNPDIEIEVERHEVHGADESDHALQPMDHPPHHPMRDHPAGHRQIAPAIHPAPLYPGAMYPDQAMGAPIYFPQSDYPAGAMPYPDGFQHDQMGREEWLEDCRTRHDSGRDRRGAPDECAAYLVQHEAQWRHMRYGYGPVMLVPIMVPVEQRAVVREYVTEEWVEEIVPAAPAPGPVKTVPVKTVPVKAKSVKPVK